MLKIYGYTEIAIREQPPSAAELKTVLARA